MNKFIRSLPFALSLFTMPLSSNAKELIVLATPGMDEGYYAEVEDDIFSFHISFANRILPNDNVVILTDEERAPDYIEELGAEHVLVMPMADIWMRDFTLSNAVDPIMFRYTAAAQDNQGVSDEVQEVFYDFIRNAGLEFRQTDLLNDGGNMVDDYAGNIVVSTKFLKDNKLTEDQARQILTEQPTIDNVAFIVADEQGGLEHSDGVVSFIEENVLIINSYAEDPEYSRQLKADLRRGLPGVEIIEIPTPYNDTRIYDSRFGSACGLYTNALVTPDRIYLPQFDVPEDSKVLELVSSLTSKEVVPVASKQVCYMGGGVRCMSWQLRGDNAQLILDAVARQNEQFKEE